MSVSEAAKIESESGSDSRVDKDLCQRCGFEVVVLGHESRCRVPLTAEESADRRSKAWIGDALHSLDVRIAVLQRGLSPKVWEYEFQRFATAFHQAAYLKSVEPYTEGNEKVLATTFETQYSGVFRDKYLARTFPEAVAAGLYQNSVAAVSTSRLGVRTLIALDLFVAALFYTSLVAGVTLPQEYAITALVVALVGTVVLVSFL